MRLTQADASFIYMEAANSPMHISSVYVLDGELSFDQLMTRFEKRMHLMPTFRQKLMHVPFSLAHPIWVDDENFDLHNHVILRELPPGTPFEEGIDAAVTMNEALLDRYVPLWRVVMISGVPGKTLLLHQTHHAMIDGASGIDVSLIIYDLDPKAGEPVPPNEPWIPEPAPNPVELMNDAVRDNLAEFNEKNPMALMTKASANATKLAKATEVMSRFVTQPAMTAPFNAGVVGAARKVGWFKKPFAEIREVRKQLGGTINDVVLAVLSEGVSRYLASHGETTEGQYLRIMCPVNVRTEDQKGALGNQVSAIFPRLPAQPMDCMQRLNVVVAETERIKREEEAQAMTILQESMPFVPPLNMLPTQLIGTPFDPTRLAATLQPPPAPAVGGMRPPNPGYNFTATNVPGVQVPQYMCGLEVTEMIGLLVLNGNVGFSATIVSYNKQLFLSFICEPRLLPDVEALVDASEEVFQELLSLASEKNQQRMA